MEDDSDFIRRLQVLTGNTEMWENFDPASWREIDSEEETAPTSQPSAVFETTEGPGATIKNDEAWDSEGSTDMILNIRHLRMEEKSQGRSYKLNKARDFAADGHEPLLDAGDLEKVDWKETGLQRGEPSSEEEIFAPWRLVKHYPEMYVGKRNGERAAPFFTDEAIHKNRIWDLYYVHQPAEINKEPVIFVPTYQFEHLLEVVNAKLDTELTIPPGVNAAKYKMRFGLGNTPRLRFLGRSTSPETFESLRQSVPEPHADDNLKNATTMGREMFLDSLAKVFSPVTKGHKSDKNKRKRIDNHRAWGRSIKRAQRYLGLRQNAAGRGETAPVVPQALDLSQAMVVEPEGSVLFVAIDIEAYEFNQNIITEIGIAVLDTAQLAKVAPGDGGKGWFPVIAARHIRIKENSWAHNSVHVHGCADHFDFGTSEFIPQAKIRSVLGRIIDGVAHADAGKKRHVVLVFHDQGQDIKYLNALGYDIEKAENVVEIVDTREMHQYIVRGDNPTSLGSVLVLLDIPCRYLHNAGNDAVYTMQAMISLAIKKRLSRLAKSGDESNGQVRYNNDCVYTTLSSRYSFHLLTGTRSSHVPYAEFVQGEGWSSNGEESDGGVPDSAPGHGKSSY
ncbi:hypothetical protein B0T22DRAFT_435798 [Podospora appendiculata]|uniref:Gfd2/YDR514C-like C-terminal domain-containing protein n=1 Tax=Podospora appendiculata TaxID=314037 RepID=A0AAE1CFQ3_9PEZI|nr:hypothetical protein B0T22DRAFT_435798 [Podospora appendiculata]